MFSTAGISQGGGLLQAVGDNCKFSRDSVKEWGLVSSATDPVESLDFYQDGEYRLRFRLAKSTYFKRTKLGWSVNIGEVIVWVLLFLFGWIGTLQLVRQIFNLAFWINRRFIAGEDADAAAGASGGGAGASDAKSGAVDVEAGKADAVEMEETRADR